MKRVFLFSLLALPLTGIAAPATLDAIWPPGAKRGTGIDVTLTGKLDPWPCQLNFSGKGFTFTPNKDKKGTGKLEIAADAPTGPLVVRATNPEGVSAPQLFIVGDLPEILEEDKDDNTIAGAQVIDAAKLPFVVNGRLPGNNELDAFKLTLKKGETIHAAVEGYTIRSLIDPVLHLYGPDGNRLAMEHDGAVHLDPRMEFTAPEAGDYTFAVTAFAHPPAASISFRGGKNAQYRLYLARNPEAFPKHLLTTDPGPDTKENKLSAGKTAAGTLSKPGEVDRYTFTGKKDEQHLITVEAAGLGFATDPVLQIFKPDGALLKLVDDANKESDPEYLWKVAADGEYAIAVSDRFLRGGPQLRYRVGASKPVPGFTATIEKSEYLLERGKSVDIKVKVTRLHEDKENLVFEIPDLPDKLTFTGPDKVPEKGGDVTLKLEAKGDAPAFQKPLTIHAFVTDKDGRKTGKPIAAYHSFKTDPNYRGPYALIDLPAVWLTIPPKKEEPKKDEPKKADPKKEEAKKAK
ncbi:hypothetical protein VSU19_20235 [Verrucomicrobiales bacterium BCK34]|nr:hypothetical protein [Verrucomicrobiales bacterium BCK34]